MTTTPRPPIARWLASTVAAILATTALVACGDDSDDAADDDDTTTTITSTTDDTTTTITSTTDVPTGAAFCEGFLGLEQAFAEAPENENEAEIPAFVEERIDPNLALIDGNEPENIAEDVQTMTTAVREATSTGDFSALETPEFLAASVTVYRSLDDACDANVVEFSAVDYDYEGVPDTLPAGVTSFVMTNDSAAGEAHEFSLVKLSDDTELGIEELLDMPEEEANQHIETFAGGTFAPADAASGMVSELTPGRWAYVCFIPVGSVGETEGTGPPHFVEGMAGEFTVE
ncbi:hypothetical protein BH24ACT4_BH24ACT4_13130 [soil metagenome]